MATQSDDIDVGLLVRIGLIGSFLTIAVSYAVTGLHYVEDDYLSDKRALEAQVVEHVEAPSADALADTEAARQAVLKRYTR
ncbi:MAG: hypothetical protein O3A95_06345 [Planctomycetota bacterium]|nr:hypothetical protein [Planctomycetota bacterium]MDA1113902.1 hypothetical protein [Planctomycetota bacterium]